MSSVSHLHDTFRLCEPPTPAVLGDTHRCGTCRRRWLFTYIPDEIILDGDDLEFRGHELWVEADGD